MPGGRLLVEHIEDVKTERGISFVKSNKDDFTGGYGGSAAADGTPQAVTGGGPFVGGNLVLGESFAETFSKSMAEAFKQLPSPVAGAPISGGNVSVDLGNAFDVLAEEIRTSRASLLDVLKETRSITDSVIASQVSISRILEGILSARSRDESDVANLNNRIIASQASISKLLESIYTNNNTKLSASNTSSIDIENRLQEFKREIKQEIETSINRIQNLVSSINVNTAGAIPAIPTENIQTTIDTSSEQTNNNKKKKKKKKKNREAIDATSVIESVVANEAIADEFSSDDFSSDEFSSDEFSSDDVFTPIDGTIRNAAFKHNDPFDNINLNEPPFEEDDISNIEEDTIDDLDFVLPEESFTSENLEDVTPLPIEEEGLASFDNDDLDFTLPEQNFTPNTDIDNEYSSDKSDDNFDFSSSEVNTFDSTDEDDEISFNNMLSDFSDDITNENNDSDGELLTTSTFSFDDENSFDDLSEPLQEQETSEHIDELDTDLGDNLDLLQNNDNTDEELSSFENDFSFNDLSDFEDANLDQANHENESNPLDEPSFDDSNITNFDEMIFDNSLDVADTTEEESLETNINEVIFDDSDITSYNEEVHLDELSLSSFEEDANKIDFNNISDDNLDGLDNFDFNSNIIEDKQDNYEEVELEESLDSVVSNFDNNEITDDDIQDINEITQEDTPEQSRYTLELDKIREALTGDSIDLSSLDEPIALDEYSDDEGLEEDNTLSDSQDDDEWEYEYVEETEATPTEQIAEDEETNTSQTADEEWEWEYVDEDGNPLEASTDEDWEWEYVEEDEESDNKEE